MSTGLSPALQPSGVIARYVLLGAALGLPAGIAWVLLAPRVAVVSPAEGTFVDSYPKGFAAADMVLTVILVVVGVILGVVASRRLHATGFRRGWAQVVGVIAAGLSAAIAARVLGWWLAGRSVHPAGDGTFDAPLSVGAPGVLLTSAFVALLVVLLYSAFADEPDPEPVMPESEPSGHSSQ